MFESEIQVQQRAKCESSCCEWSCCLKKIGPAILLSKKPFKISESTDDSWAWLLSSSFYQKKFDYFLEDDHSYSVFLSNLFHLNIYQDAKKQLLFLFYQVVRLFAQGVLLMNQLCWVENGIRLRGADLRPIILCFWANGVISAAENVAEQLKETLYRNRGA